MRPTDSGMNGCPDMPGWMLMHNAMSAPSAAAAALLDRRLRVERHADVQLERPCPLDQRCRHVDSFEVERDAVGARLLELLEVALGPLDHEVAVEPAIAIVDQPGDGLQHDRSHRDRLDEVPVSDVEVEDAGPGIEHGRHLFAEPGEIGRVDRRLDLDAAIPRSARPHSVGSPTRLM